MTKIILTCKILMATFLVVCVGVHVQGIISPFTSEPLWSHIVHIISYTLCLIAIIRPFSRAWVAYTIGAIYPFMYHARCVWMTYDIHHWLSPVCTLVIVLLPAGCWLVWPKGPSKAL